MSDTVVCGPITDKADADLAVAELVGRHGRTGRHGIRATDDRVGTQMPHMEVGDVHPATTTPTVALFLAEQLCHGAEQMLLQCRIERRVAVRAVEIVLTDSVAEELEQTRGVGPLQRKCTLGDRVSMTTVSRGDVVVRVERRHGANCYGFLADGQMSCADEAELRQWLVAGALEQYDGLFEMTDVQQMVIHAYSFICRQPGCQLALQITLVDKLGYRREFYRCALKVGQHVHVFGHGLTPA